MSEVNNWFGLVAFTLAGLFALLNKRESNNHDRRFSVVETRLATTESELSACNKKHTASELLLEEKTQALAERDAKDKEELQQQLRSQQAQITRLRKQTTGKDAGDADTDH